MVNNNNFFFFTMFMVSIIGEDLAALSLAASMALWSDKKKTKKTNIINDIMDSNLW